MININEISEEELKAALRKKKGFNKLNKTTKFLDIIVKMIFYSTFLFTVATIFIACTKDWEQLAIMLTDRWFTIMVGELIVTGAIQIVKELIQIKLNKEE